MIWGKVQKLCHTMGPSSFCGFKALANQYPVSLLNRLICDFPTLLPLLTEDDLIFTGFFWRIRGRKWTSSPVGNKRGSWLGEQVSDMSSRTLYPATAHQNPQQNNPSMHTSNQLNQWHNRHHADQLWSPREIERHTTPAYTGSAAGSM